MLKLKVFDQSVRVKFKPHDEEFAVCNAFGKAYAEKMIEMYQLSCDILTNRFLLRVVVSTDDSQ